MSNTGARGRVGPLRSRAGVVTSIAFLMSAGLTSGAGAQDLSPDRSPSPAHTAAPWATPPAGTVLEVQAFDLGFTPNAIELLGSGASHITLHNVGQVVHNLTVDALGLQIVASRGDSAEATLLDPPPGTYEFYCSVSGHKEGGMVGTLVVRESAPVGETSAPSPDVVTGGPTASG